LSSAQFSRLFLLRPAEATLRDEPLAKTQRIFAWESSSGAGSAEYIPTSVAARDCLFLVGIVILSALSYLNRLGFYADDWYIWSSMYAAKDQSLGGLLHSLSLTGTIRDGLGVRPAQSLYQVLAYMIFGLHPLPYQICNTLMLAAVAIFFYASLRELRLPRYITLLSPLVYVLLPHYATDRFWIAAHQAIFSQAFFFAGFYAGLRAVRANCRHTLALKCVSIFSFAVALLFYEVILSLVPVVVFIVAYGIYVRGCHDALRRRGAIVAAIRFILGAAACLGPILLYKMKMTDRVNVSFEDHSPAHIGSRLRDTLSVTLRFNMLHYGIALPRTALALHRFSGRSAFTIFIAAVIALAILRYLSHAFRSGQSAIPGTAGALYLIIAGFLIFVIDYMPFSMLRSNFSYDGTSNRVVIAAAIGTAFVLIGGIAFLISTLVAARHKSWSTSAAIALICALNYVCIASFGDCWARAYSQQQAIVAGVRGGVTIPRGGVLLLDGVCRYVGPAPVLENGFDAGGAFRVAYGDPLLQGDVVSPSLTIGNENIGTTFYGVDQKYPYGETFWLYNVQRKMAVQLVNRDVALNYFQTVNPDKNSDCPVGIEGIGSPTS
jgi:hypothetical protein